MILLDAVIESGAAKDRAESLHLISNGFVSLNGNVTRFSRRTLSPNDKLMVSGYKPTQVTVTEPPVAEEIKPDKKKKKKDESISV